MARVPLVLARSCCLLSFELSRDHDFHSPSLEPVSRADILAPARRPAARGRATWLCAFLGPGRGRPGAAKLWG